jgi:CubicO group peptidase (beta-lactamase class C family)
MMEVNMKRFITLAVALVLVLGTASSSRLVFAQQSNYDFSEFEKAIRAEMEKTSTPGTVVAIISGDKVIFSKAYGYSNLATKTPLTTDMIFRLGGPSTLFSSLAFLTLAEQGKIDLEKPLGKYINKLSPKLSEVNLRQLLIHTAGLKNSPPHDHTKDDTAFTNYMSKWKDDLFIAEPGRFFSYAESGYFVAGYVLETVGKKPFEEQMTEILFKPLGMESTKYPVWKVIPLPFSQGHDIPNHGHGNEVKITDVFIAREAFWDDQLLYPGRSIFTNLNDLSRFFTTILNEGKLDGKQVLPAAAVKKLLTPQTDMLSVPGKYGYGVRIRSYRGVEVLENVAQIIGFSGRIWMVPEQRFALIIMANRYDSTFRAAALKALETVVPTKPNPTTVAQKEELPISASEMGDYIGLYTHSVRTSELLVKEGKLYYKYGKAEWPVKKIGSNRFSYTPAGPLGAQEFLLIPGKSGKIEYLHIWGEVARKTPPTAAQVGTVTPARN